MGPLAGILPSDSLEKRIRQNIALCWLRQEPDKRSQEEVRRAVLRIVEEQLQDIEAIVKDLDQTLGSR